MWGVSFYAGSGRSFRAYVFVRVGPLGSSAAMAPVARSAVGPLVDPLVTTVADRLALEGVTRSLSQHLLLATMSPFTQQTFKYMASP